MSMKSITNPQLRALHAIFKRMGWDEEQRHGFIREYTNRRTESTASLTFEEARSLLMQLNDADEQRNAWEAKRLLSAIYKMSFHISFINEGYGSETKADVEMNKAKISLFTLKHSKCKKRITEMNLSELKSVKEQFEALAAKYKKS